MASVSTELLLVGVAGKVLGVYERMLSNLGRCRGCRKSLYGMM